MYNGSGDNMKKIVVMSDSHGSITAMHEVKEREKDGDFYVHCGDSEASLEELSGWIVVRGNNDWMAPFLSEVIFEVEGHRIYVCHGHYFGYFERTEHMLSLLQEKQCDILLSGHTHVPSLEKIHGMYLINPGSTTLPRRGSEKGYCVIYIDEEKVDVKFRKL